MDSFTEAQITQVTKVCTSSRRLVAISIVSGMARRWASKASKESLAEEDEELIVLVALTPIDNRVGREKT
jgi:hypothetical protein